MANNFICHIREALGERMKGKTKQIKPIIGQEAICPDGLGRVVAFEDDFPSQWIKVSTYINDRCCKWSFCNVELIDPRK